MARESRKKQEQLSFPGLDVPESVPESAQALMSSPVLPVEDVPVEKVVRKRSTRPRMVLVREVPEAEVVLPTAVDVQVDGQEGAKKDKDMVLVEAASSSSVSEPITPTPSAVSAEPVAHIPATASSASLDAVSVSSISATGPVDRLGVWRSAALLLASGVAIVALSVGGYQFVETQKVQRESMLIERASLLQVQHAKEVERNARAVELLLKYNELMIQLGLPVPKGARKEARYWKESLAVSLLESLYNLTRGNREWENVIALALDRHGRFIREQRLSCSAYTGEFVAYLEKVLVSKSTALCRD
jgi:hypothetical protein